MAVILEKNIGDKIRNDILGVVKLLMSMLGCLMMLIIPVTATNAHESWLQPVDYQPPLNTSVKLDVVTGQNFSGHRLSFNPARFVRLEFDYGSGANNIAGRLGDLPAIQFESPKEGLYSVIYQTKGSEIQYDSAEQFGDFARKEGVEWILGVHEERGLPAFGFYEEFIRYSKALIGVGHGRGQDIVMGLPFELVALQNPMHLETGQLTLRLMWRGEVEEGLLSVYEKSMDQEIVLQSYLIAANGEVTIPLQPNREYLLNAVKMEIVEPDQENQPVWRSHWASLTFSTDISATGD